MEKAGILSPKRPLRVRGDSVKSTSSHLQQRLLRGEVLSFTQEKRKRQCFLFLY